MIADLAHVRGVAPLENTVWRTRIPGGFVIHVNIMPDRDVHNTPPMCARVFLRPGEDSVPRPVGLFGPEFHDVQAITTDLGRQFVACLTQAIEEASA